jgi:hypothetical protein
MPISQQRLCREQLGVHPDPRQNRRSACLRSSLFAVSVPDQGVHMTQQDIDFD